MMKIVFYINVLGYGGAERVITNLANQFSLKGNETILITSYKLQTEYTVDSLVRRIYLYEDELKGGFIKRNINYTMQLRRIIKKLKPDIIVSFMAEPNFRALLASFALPIKTV